MTSQNGLVMLPLVFALGLRHGIDPDHLAAIDGLTRWNRGSRLSRWAGSLFSFGHGIVVVIAAVLFGTVFYRTIVPRWTALSGALLSAFFLILIGGLNVHAAWRSNRNGHYKPIGLRSGFFGDFFRVRQPWLIIGVGALFALSFDTISQAALFSVAASQNVSWLLPAILGLAFMLGMMAPDSLNGLWLSRLLRQADRRAQIVARLLGASVGIVSLVIAAIELTPILLPSWRDGIDASQVALVVAMLAVTIIGLPIMLATLSGSSTGSTKVEAVKEHRADAMIFR